MEPDPVTHDGARSPAVPLTERILARLGRPRWLWITIWSLVALISPLVFVPAIRASGNAFEGGDVANVLATQAVLAYACFVLLWGVGVLASQAADLRLELAGLEVGKASADLFGGIGSSRGPLALTVIVVAISSANSWARYGPLAPLVSLPLLFLYMLPILTFVWVYLTILVDVNRLGRRPLVLDRFPEDRTLGLGKVGALAATGLGLILLAAVPVLVAGSDEPVTLGVSLAIVALTIAIFVLSMWRVHRQMSAAKARYVAITSRLYADAYAPIRESTDVETLKASATALSAAQSLEERAHNLQTWPIDEGTLRFVVIVITGVVTGLIVRGSFAALGY